MIVAGIDIGTNTVRLIVADIVDGKIKSIIHQNRSVTRLGEDLIKTGYLKDTAIERTLKVVEQFYREAVSYNVERIKCCATSAVRESSNGDLFLNHLKEKGVIVEVIDGELEGELTCRGVFAGLNVKGYSLIVDIGGGSTELIYTDGSEVKTSTSYKIGVVKLADIFDFKGVCDKELFNRATDYIDDIFKEYNFPSLLDNFIATAGTPTTLAAIDLGLVSYDYRKVNGYEMDKTRIVEILSRISSIPFEERKGIAGLEAGREDLIIPGGLILLYLMNKAGKDKVIVSDFGLREGIAIAATL